MKKNIYDCSSSNKNCNICETFHCANQNATIVADLDMSKMIVNSRVINKKQIVVKSATCSMSLTM